LYQGTASAVPLPGKESGFSPCILPNPQRLKPMMLVFVRHG
jgi:hypothetical protein